MDSVKSGNKKSSQKRGELVNSKEALSREALPPAPTNQDHADPKFLVQTENDSQNPANAFFEAARNGNVIEMKQLLDEKQVEVDSKTSYNATALHMACWHDQYTA